MLSTKEYIYARIKNISINDDGITELFLFAGLTVNTLTHSNGKVTKNVKAIVSKIIEIPVENASSTYLDMPNHDLRENIKEEEFERLKKLANDNVTEFFNYTPSNEI